MADTTQSALAHARTQRWEVGSEFHWDPAVLLPPGARAEARISAPNLYASATGALRALLRDIGHERPRTLFFPTFFCVAVAAGLERDVARIGWYRELPDGDGPDLESLHAAPGDVVVAVNTFGKADPKWWQDWRRDHPDVVYMEDHTHAPFSDWSATSDADYCVASLRKALPVPDGGALWSPQGLPVPPPSGVGSESAAAKLEAMMLKAAWLDGAAVDKEAFRSLQLEGEDSITRGVAGISAFSRAVLPALDLAGMQTRRTHNARRLEDGVASFDGPWDVLLPSSGGDVPFNVQLVCDTEDLRNGLRTALAREGVYAPVHWPQPWEGLATGDERAERLSARILTIPVDHRYGDGDVDRVLELLSSFAAHAPRRDTQ